MSVEQFEQQKSKLRIDENMEDVLSMINNKDFSGVADTLKKITSMFELGIQLENTEDSEYYSFNDNIEFFTKLIENAHESKPTNITALNPNYFMMYYLLGYAYVELENPQLAAEAFIKALRWNPVSASTYLEFAEIYKNLKDWDNCLVLLQNGLKYSASTKSIARAYRGLGYYYCEQNNFDLAVALYMHSLRFEESDIVKHEVAYIYQLSDKKVVMPNPDEAETFIMENGIDIDVSNYVFAGYTKFLQALKDANEQDAYSYYEGMLKSLILTSEKLEYLNNM